MALYLLDNEKGIKVQVFSTPKNVQGKPRPYCEIRWEEAGVTRRKTVTGENFAKAKAQEIFENLLLDAPADLDP